MRVLHDRLSSSVDQYVPYTNVESVSQHVLTVLLTMSSLDD